MLQCVHEPLVLWPPELPWVLHDLPIPDSAMPTHEFCPPKSSQASLLLEVTQETPVLAAQCEHPGIPHLSLRDG